MSTMEEISRATHIGLTMRTMGYVIISISDEMKISLNIMLYFIKINVKFINAIY